jgi:hypothetical protein
LVIYARGTITSAGCVTAGLATVPDHFAAGVGNVVSALTQVGDAVPALQREIANAAELATRYGYRLEEPS